MEDATPRIRPVSATLMPDCSISLGLAIDGWDEPQFTVVEQSVDFLDRVGHEPRVIKLDGGDRTDELAREHIARRIAQIERDLARQQTYERYRQQAAAPAVSAYEPYVC